MAHEHFILKIPDGLPLDRAGPILGAGITCYDPLVKWGATSGKFMTIGIVGVGGLGTMGIKLARALGHRVVAITTNENKRKMAREKGAHDFIISSDPESMKSEKYSIDLILNTVPSDH